MRNSIIDLVKPKRSEKIGILKSWATIMTFPSQRMRRNRRK